ncbi:MAG: D-alanine--D-alanine ligase [Pseudomonadales bacterium]|nr:D-alanine--D-alanine ligase [Pseudomonadales bacterium]NRA15112.1 D-alanine--D-alanine ligase [Oceanospirillaceae bacterium]
MPNKINIGVVFGGRSAEHEVSLMSAKSVVAAMDKEKYQVHLIGITHQGKWLYADSQKALEYKTVDEQSLTPTSIDFANARGTLVDNTATENNAVLAKLDVIFPVLHGPYGEDGTIQGLFELSNLAYVGCGVASSAIAMDKALAKQAFKAAGLLQMDYQIFKYAAFLADPDLVIEKIEQQFTYPVFVKPANMGSSVGITKAHHKSELSSGLKHAFEFDNKIIIEATAENCAEVECAILGLDQPKASAVGEILAGKEFYDYETKYFDNKSATIIPAHLPQTVMDEVKAAALIAFDAIDGSGLSRVDFFVNRDTHKIYINEVNTMPGFTPISMYSKLWAASGVQYSELIDQLIELALTRHSQKARLSNQV